MKLNDLHNSVKRPVRKRVGRGDGSGNGKTSGRGDKGHGQRAGYTFRPHFEAGQLPLFRRLPKRGFTNPNHRFFAVINVGELNQNFEAGQEVTAELLTQRGLIGDVGTAGMKVLGDGELIKALKVKAQKFSASARQKIEAAGGTCEEV